MTDLIIPQATQILSPCKVVILGAARSGLAAAHFLAKRGYTVSVSDAKVLNDETRQELTQAGFAFEEGHSEAFLSQADLMVASPGIPLTAKPYQIAAQQRIPVISEIELASHFCQSKIIALTGSNGKTTTVSLLEKLLQNAGFKAQAGGNIGTPMISLLEQNLDYIILELSSFQLETTFHLKPTIAILLNLFENHLDRHGDMQSYFKIKSRLFQCQDASDHAVLNANSPWCQQVASQIQAQVHWFNTSDQLALTWQSQGIQYQGQTLLALSDLKLQGKHNLENIFAALIVADILKLPAETVGKTLGDFQGIAHRMESLGEFKQRLFINDSKATNYLAAQTAINGLTRPLILIAGGQDKGGDFNPLAQAIQSKVKHVILLGESAQIFAQALSQSGYNQSTIVDDMQSAVELAYQISEPGDVILLSPATASYDRYRNFEERGDDFRQHVAALVSKNQNS